MPATDLTPYRRLVELAETECALLQAGHLDEVETLQLEWTEVMAALPSPAPADAAPYLRRASALSAQAQLELRGVMDGLQREMGQAGRTRAVGRAYGGAGFGAPAGASIDTAA